MTTHICREANHECCFDIKALFLDKCGIGLVEGSSIMWYTVQTWYNVWRMAIYSHSFVWIQWCLLIVLGLSYFVLDSLIKIIVVSLLWYHDRKDCHIRRHIQYFHKRYHLKVNEPLRYTAACICCQVKIHRHMPRNVHLRQKGSHWSTCPVNLGI